MPPILGGRRLSNDHNILDVNALVRIPEELRTGNLRKEICESECVWLAKRYSTGVFPTPNIAISSDY